jgi:AcrR family transcriptional regulator
MSAQPESQKTDPRVARTQKLIEEAFLAAMEEKGFEDLSVNDVTDRAGINRVTFYSHFDDKYVLLGYTIRKMFSDEIERQGLSDRALDADSVRDLFLAVCSYVTGLHEHCRPPHVHMDWILEAQITAVSAELFTRWAGKSAAPVDAKSLELTSTAASSAMYGLVLQWIRSGKRSAASTFVGTTLPIVTGILRI